MKYIRNGLVAVMLAGMLATGVGVVHAETFVHSNPILLAEDTPAPAGPSSGENQQLSSGQLPIADPKNASDGLTADLKNTLDTIVFILSLLLKTMYAFMVPIIGLISKFLSNDWVTGSFLNIDVIIEIIWQFVRNLVNVIVVLYLIYVAARNIVPFGGKADNADIKQVLPKVALALVVVNFSLLFCRTILTVSNVATTAAFSIPGTVGTNVTDENSANSYSFFIWAQPIGAEDKKKVSSCPADYSMVDQTNPTSGALTKMCVPKSGNGLPIPVDQEAAKAQETYMMECLHKNYAFRAADPARNNESTFFANPQLQAGKYVEGDSHYNRIFFSGSKGTEGNDMKLYNEELSKKKVLVKEQIGGEGDYPYYSDCITSLSALAFSSKNAMYVYAFNLLKIGNYEDAFANISTFSDITVRVLTGAAFVFVFLIVNVALLVAVVGRAFLLWIMMAMSPLWVLTEILKIWKGQQDADAFLGGTARFINLAMMPAYVGVVLSLGFVMYHFLSYVGGVGEGIDSGRLQLGSITMYFNPDTTLVGGLGGPFQLMFPLLALCALFIAVFAAIKFGLGSKNFVMNAVESIQKMGTKVGKYVGSMPLEMPLVPIPGKGNFSINSLKGVPEKAVEYAEGERRQRHQDDVRRLFPGASDFTQYRSEFNRALQTAGKNARYDSGLANFHDTHSNSPEYREVLIKAAKQMRDTSGNFAAPTSDLRVDHNGQSYTFTKEQMTPLAGHLQRNRTTYDLAESDIESNRLNTAAVTNLVSTMKPGLYDIAAAAPVAANLIKTSGGFTFNNAAGTSVTANTPEYNTLAALVKTPKGSNTVTLSAKDLDTSVNKAIAELEKAKVPKKDFLDYLTREFGNNTELKDSKGVSLVSDFKDYIQKRIPATWS